MPSNVRSVHLLGIAGSGVGTFAMMLRDAGYVVKGSDQNVYPPMSDRLTAQGIEWYESWDKAHLDWAPDVVVVGNVCRCKPEAVAAEARGIPSVSFSSLERLISCSCATDCCCRHAREDNDNSTGRSSLGKSRLDQVFTRRCREEFQFRLSTVC